jgi:hypothetical protein
LADADDYKDPQTPLTNAQALSVEIVTATDPTELVWTDGEPQMGTIAGTDLLYWTNTDSDVFLAIDSQQLYVLMSGRWYSGPSRNGPWTFVPSDKLPPDFARIPPDSDHGDVLAFVAGTQAAHDAVADTQIPQTAGVDRKNYDQPAVEYDGDPQFQAVQGTSCSYAVNTASAVVSVGGRYYCCDDAVWYTSAASTGPWDVCTAVPTDIYTLPPSCPVYSVRYCYVYGYTPDVVYCGYLPGYVGCYRYHDCVVYGTGYYYHPWWGHRYYPRPWTYGFAAHYNSYVGHWGFSFGLATGGGRSWIGDGPRAAGVLHPWFGYGGYRPVVVHNDVRVDMFRDQWRTRVHDERAEPVNRDRYVRNVYERRKDVRWEPARIQAAQIEHRDAEQHAQKADENRGGNDVFTDHQGNVYRRTTDGWEIRDQGNWTSARADQHDQHDVHAEEHPQAPAAEHHDDHPAAAEPHAAPVQPEQQHPAESHPAEQHPAAQHAEPAKDTHDLDRDYRARISGDQRMHGYSPSSDEHKASAPPADEHKADTHEAAPEHGGGGGGGGGSEDHKGK